MNIFGYDFMSAFIGLLLLWGATWLPIFFVMITASMLGFYRPSDVENRRKWKAFVKVAFVVLLIFYLIILRINHVGLN